jgi:histidinol-phosphatase (PHP family)
METLPYFGKKWRGEQMKFITDIHTHSYYSFDGIDLLKDIIAGAQERGVAFYGVSEHADYDIYLKHGASMHRILEEEEYFHEARHLQDDYAGVMNVLVGAELGYSPDERVCEGYKKLIETYAPDFIVNSVHSCKGDDYYDGVPYQNADGSPRDIKAVYEEYLDLILSSVNAPYAYDIIGHIGYADRYAPSGSARITLAEYGDKIDAILQAIIEKNKILEVNTSTKNLPQITLPNERLLQRYYDLGGRNISFGSDAHETGRIADKFEDVVRMLKKIGFTHFTVPCKGEYIKVEM